MEGVLEPVGGAGRGMYFGIGGGSRDISRPLSFWGDVYKRQDGTIYHVNRACKVMVCQQQELMRRVSEACGNLPFMAFDGDQAD